MSWAGNRREIDLFGQSIEIVHKSFMCFHLLVVRGVRGAGACVVRRRAFKLTLAKINIFFLRFAFLSQAIVPVAQSLAHATRVHKKSLVNLHIPLKHDLLHSECAFSLSAPSSTHLRLAWHRRRIRYSVHAIRQAQAIGAYHQPRRYSRYIS